MKKKKGISNLRYKEGLLFEWSKESDTFKEIIYKKKGCDKNW